MALTADQKKRKLAVLDRKIARTQAAVAVLDALKAEREWVAAAPEAPARPKRAAKEAAPTAENVAA